MKSSQALQKELLTLHRRLQAHYTQIESHKSGVNLVAALFSSNVRRQSLQTVANARREIDSTIQQIQDVQEDQIASLFLECWEEELSGLSDDLFVDVLDIRRYSTYSHAQYRSLKQRHLQLLVRKPKTK